MLLLGGACAGSDQPADDAHVEPPPAAVAQPPENLLVPPAPPAGLHLAEIMDLRSWHLFPFPTTLYGDAEAADPLAEPLLLVVWRWSEDGEAPGGPHYQIEDFRPVTVQGHDGSVGRLGDDVWVTWGTTDGEPPESTVSVVGQGFSEAEVLRAAQSVVLSGLSDEEVRGGRKVDGYVAIAPAGLPEGLSALAGGRVAFGSLTIGHPAIGPSVQWRYGGSNGYILVTVAEGGRELELLARATVRGNDRPIRGVIGTVGTPRNEPPGDPDPTVRYMWAEDGMVTIIDVRGLADDVVAEFVASLTPMPTADGLALLQGSFANVAPEGLVREGEAFAVGGRWDGGVWAVGVAGSGPGMTATLHGVTNAGAPFETSAGGPPGVYVPDAAHRLVTGSLSGDVDRVDIQFPDGSLVPAETGRVAGIPLVFYGQWLTVTEGMATYVALGYDSAGNVVVRSEFAT